MNDNITVCPPPPPLEPLDIIVDRGPFEYPILHSRPNATKKLCLAMQGYFNPNWGSKTNITTPPYPGDLNSIIEIWARVAEDYAPFDIDVTTELYPEQNGVTAIVAIGGNWSDWYGHSAGGVAWVGGFYNLMSGVGYVFSDALSNYPKYIAEAASHEGGHLFGLQHQASWNGDTLVSEYNTGDGYYAPIMGIGYSAPRTLWFNGPTSFGPANLQDDYQVLSNMIGLIPDDNNEITPLQLITNGGKIDISGIINKNTDKDKWSFFTAGGNFDVSINTNDSISNLDAFVDLTDRDGQIIGSGKSFALSILPGKYYLTARGNGVYGDEGVYTITGNVIPFNGILLQQGQELTLNVIGHDKKGNQAIINNAIWTASNGLVDLTVMNNTVTCVVKPTVGLSGPVKIICFVNGISASIDVTVA